MDDLTIETIEITQKLSIYDEHFALYGKEN